MKEQWGLPDWGRSFPRQVTAHTTAGHPGKLQEFGMDKVKAERGGLEGGKP